MPETRYICKHSDGMGHCEIFDDGYCVEGPCSREELVEYAPVRHGRWERIGLKGRKGLPIYPCCSACGMVSAGYRSEWEGLRGPWKYCPNCGAKMDLEGW